MSVISTLRSFPHPTAHVLIEQGTQGFANVKQLLTHWAKPHPSTLRGLRQENGNFKANLG